MAQLPLALKFAEQHRATQAAGQFDLFGGLLDSGGPTAAAPDPQIASETREDYANDLGYAHSLVAVSASSNRSKSDRDPTEWLPALGRCTYAKYWIGVKYRWRLSVNPAEKSTLARVLAGCPPLMVLPALASRTENPNAQTPGSTGSGSGSASGGGTSSGPLDPRFDTCGEANAAGYGPYSRGQDPEYRWYIDRDSDGVACER